MSALERRGHRKFSASPPESERAARDNASRSGVLPPFRFVSSAARVATGILPVACGLRRSLTLSFLCLPLLFAFAAPAGAQTIGFVNSGTSIDEATQGKRTVLAPVFSANPAVPDLQDVVVNLEIVASESTATRNVDYRMSALTCRIGVGHLCHIPFSLIYTPNCELDETVVLRMTGNSNSWNIDPARNTFTIKILETLDDGARIPNGEYYSGSVYARQRCTADGINWKRDNTLLNQGNGLESQDDQHSLQSEEGNDQQQADYSELKAQVRTWAGQTQHGQAHVDRWMRVLAAFGEQDAIQQGYTAMTATEAQNMADTFTASRWNPIVEALTDLESRAAAESKSETEPEPEPEPEPVACVSQELEDDVEDYSEETHYGEAHVERWLRVLQTFRGTANDATVMTAAEAQEMADNFSAGRWNPVVAAIQCLEEQALQQAMSN